MAATLLTARAAATLPQMSLKNESQFWWVEGSTNVLQCDVPLPPGHTAEVAINVYTLESTQCFNRFTEAANLGGAYHIGVEVYYNEWTYGYEERGTGVFFHPAGEYKKGIFKERIVVGQTKLSPHKVLTILGDMRSEWDGEDYNFVSHNCIDFAREFLEKMGFGGTIPAKYTQMADAARWWSQTLGLEWFWSEPNEDVSDLSTQQFAPKKRMDPKLEQSIIKKYGPALVHFLYEDIDLGGREVDWMMEQRRIYARAKKQFAV